MSKHMSCIVDGCSKKQEAKGLCCSHYYHQRKYGDPLAGKFSRTRSGEPRRFYEEVVLTYDGDECLIWPYAKLHNGYAMMTSHGRSNRVSRIVCEDTNGPPPTPEHQAAHSCGNGHLGCVAKKHLSWKTPTENQADRIIHGTVCRGESSGSSKLTSELVLYIYSLKGKLGQKKIAKNFNVGRTTVAYIHRGKSWSWLTNSKAIGAE